MVLSATPVVLLAQGGGHDHVLTVGVTIGPTVLRMALLVAVPAVAGFALLRGFLAEPDRRSLTAVLATGAGAAVLELMLSGGLSLSERFVPLLLALLAVPLYLARSRDRRFAPAVQRARRCAPWVFWPVAALAAGLFTRAWLGGAATTNATTNATASQATLLHTGVVLALVALAWFAVARTRHAAGTLSMRLGAGVLAMALLAGAAHATVLRPVEPVAAAAATGY